MLTELNLKIMCLSQSYMDSEIMSIMSQYMPLDSQNKVESHSETETLRQGAV